MKKSNFLRKKFLNAPRGITLMSMVVTIIIMLILAGVAIRAITTDEGVIDEAKSAKTATEMADLREFVDIAILQAETAHTNAKMEDVIQQLIDNGIIEDASQVDIETGTITVGKNTLDGALADYVITPGEKYYGNKNIVPTTQNYFNFTINKDGETATITGVKDEYAVKIYYNGEVTKYTAVIKDGENYVTDVVIPYEYIDENGKKYTVTGIGDSAFGLKDSSTWDAGLSNVENTFTSFVLPNTITTIGKSAFRGTTGLESINIPNTVTSIGDYAFRLCGGLSSSLNLSGITNIGRNAFQECKILTNVNLGQDLTKIGQTCFDNCTNLISINIPTGVTAIEEETFMNCTKLKTIKLPEDLQSIALRAFYNCQNLSDIKIPSTVQTLGGSAFSGCKSLTSVEIPEGVTSIESRLFSVCSNLSSITIPNTVTEIKDYAFYSCTSLTNIDIPDNVTTIGVQAFSMTGLTSIDIPSKVTSIGNYAFASTLLETIEIPNGVTSLEHHLFRSCKKLTIVKLPNTITSIGEFAFEDCPKLNTINIPNSVASIGKYAFYNCKLSSINIPSSVAIMENYVFYKWTENQTINCEITESEKPDTWDAKWDYFDGETPRKATLNWGVEM